MSIIPDPIVHTLSLWAPPVSPLSINRLALDPIRNPFSNPLDFSFRPALARSIGSDIPFPLGLLTFPLFFSLGSESPSLTAHYHGQSMPNPPRSNRNMISTKRVQSQFGSPPAFNCHLHSIIRFLIQFASFPLPIRSALAAQRLHLYVTFDLLALKTPKTLPIVFVQSLGAVGTIDRSRPFLVATSSVVG